MKVLRDVLAGTGQRCLLLVLTMLTGPLHAQGEVTTAAFTPFDVEAFVRHVRLLGVDEQRILLFRERMAPDGVATAADALLRLAVLQYDEAAVAAERGLAVAPAQLVRLLSETKDPYVRAHARYRLARALLAGDAAEQALVVLREFLTFDRGRSALDPEVVFFYGEAAAELGSWREARQAYGLLLKDFPGVPPPLLEVARKRLAEVAQREASPLHELAEVMDVARKRIAGGDVGAETQALQEAVLTQLREILQQIQEEQQAAGAPGSSSPVADPAKRSELAAGGGPPGTLRTAEGDPGRFGDLKQREREAVEAELQQGLPGAYRRLLEDYYRKLGRGR